MLAGIKRSICSYPLRSCSTRRLHYQSLQGDDWRSAGRSKRYISLNAAFNKQLDEIWQAKDRHCDKVWRHSLGNMAFSIVLKSVQSGFQSSVGLSVRCTLYNEARQHVESSEYTCN